MATTQKKTKEELTFSEKLELLKGEMPYKWREQQVNAHGAVMLAYIDARQLFDKLDEVLGVDGWQSDFRQIDGKLFGGIGVKKEFMTGGYEWIWKWDTGSESNVEKEKGEVSDSLKRAGVQLGVGRFLYSLGNVKLKVANYNGKFKVADDSGNILWDKDAINELCIKAVKEGVLDRTKLKGGQTPPNTNTPAKKPTLVKGSEQHKAVIKALETKQRTIAQVVGHYQVDEALLKELKEIK